MSGGVRANIERYEKRLREELVRLEGQHQYLTEEVRLVAESIAEHKALIAEASQWLADNPA